MFYAFNNCARTTNEDNRTTTFTGKCIVTGEEVSVTVPLEGLRRYEEGSLIQDAFPELSSGDREFLISGYSAEGWAKTFG